MAMKEDLSILEFAGVSLHPATPHVGGLEAVNFVLSRGEIAVVELEEGREHSPLASLAQGLIPPDSGHVRFKGENWAEMPAARISTQRGLIRRVYEHYGWITNLDVMENLRLAECYHTRRPMEEIVQEIRELARRFGVDPVPDARPSRVHGMVLRKLEWVRAFVGEPELILLERPFFNAPRADAVKLTQAVCEAARKGVAVLWLADDPHILEDCGASVSRYRMDGEKLLAVTDGREKKA